MIAISRQRTRQLLSDQREPLRGVDPADPAPLVLLDGVLPGRRTGTTDTTGESTCPLWLPGPGPTSPGPAKNPLLGAS
jgi:hypothetical protein